MATKETDLDEVIYVRVTGAEKRKIERAAQRKGLRHVAEYVRQVLHVAIAQDS
jgi:mobilization protein NikA